MKLHPDKANYFLKFYKGLLAFSFYSENSEMPEALLDFMQARETLFNDPEIIDEFKSFKKEWSDAELSILKNIENSIKGTFIYIKTLKKHSIFLETSTNKFYCVLGITDSIDDIIPKKFAMIDTVLLNFEDVIICDGLIALKNIVVGPNIRKSINEDYKIAKEKKELVNYIKNAFS